MASASQSARWISLFVVILFMVALAACGSAADPVAAPEPTRAAVPTATPAATDIPALPTVPPPGTEENPLTIVLAAPDAAVDDLDSLAETLSAEADLQIAVKSGDNGGAFDALCGGAAVAASLDVFAAIAALEQGCGEAVYQAESDGELTTQTQLISLSNRIFNIPNFRDRVICRPDALSAEGWIVPSLAMRAENVNPFTDLGDVQDIEDPDEMLAAVQDLTCDVGITAVGAEAELDNPDEILVITILPPVAHEMLVLSSRLDEPTREALLDALAAADDDIAAILDVDALQMYDSETVAELQTLLTDAGVDVTTLAR